MRKHSLSKYRQQASEKVTLMTSPSRKNLQTTAWKIPCPVSPVRLGRRLLCISVLSVGVIGFSESSLGQYQQPSRFQKPNSVRSILGVRNSQASQSKPRQTSSRQTSSRQTGNEFSNSQYTNRGQTRRDSIVIAAPRDAQSVQYQETVKFQDPISQSGAIGSGVKKNRSISNRLPRSQGSGQFASPQSKIDLQQVDPLSDPFGDRSAARLAPPKLNSPQMIAQPRSAKRPSRAPNPRSTYAQNRSQLASSAYPQESILRQPATSSSPVRSTPQASRSSNAGYQPNGFQAPRQFGRLQENIPNPTQGGGFSPKSNQPTGQPQDQPNNLRKPIQQNPIQETDPMNQEDPLRLDPMVRRDNSFDLDCEEINGVMLHKSIRDISLTLTPNLEEGRSAPEFCSFEGVPTPPRCWNPQTFVWTASAICSKPLYYQDIQLERYGHTRGPIIQPLISAAHFFGNAAIVPYKAGIHPPNECVYPLGYYRPGDCAPWLYEPFPWSVRGAASQAAWIASYSGIVR